MSHDSYTIHIKGEIIKGPVTVLALESNTRSISSYANRHTSAQSFTAYDWLRPYTNFLPLITIKIVTLVFMQHKHTGAGLRMAHLFIVVVITKGPSMTGASLTCASEDRSSSLSLARILADWLLMPSRELKRCRFK